MGLLTLLSHNFRKTKKINSEQQENFKSLFMENPEAICQLSLRGELMAINKRLKSLLGYGIKDRIIIGKMIQLSGSADKVRYHFHKATQGFTTSFELTLPHKLGHKIPLQISFIPSFEGDTLVSIFGLCKDMTKKITFEKEISHLHENLEVSQRISNIGNWDYDLKTGEVYWSKQMYQIFGIHNPQFIPTWEKVLLLVHPQDRAEYEKDFKKYIFVKDTISYEHRIIRGDGVERNLLIRSDSMLNKQGEVVRIIGTVQDITDKKSLELKLAQREELLESVNNHLPLAIWSYDKVKNRMSYCSRGVENIYGVKPEKFQEDSRMWLKMVHPDDKPKVERNHSRLVEGVELNQQYRIIDANGVLKWVQTHVIPYFDQEGNHIRLDGIVQDVTDKVNYSESLAFIADHDYLTKVPNRRYFERKLQELIDYSSVNNKEFGVFYLDLDRFKYINDTLGHEIGDQLLVSLSERLKRLLQTYENTLLARIGGDEFTICLTDTDGIEGSIKFAKKVISEIEKPFYLNDYELFVTTSIGISMYPADGREARDLLKNADIALYKAKESGRNDWHVFSSSMNIESFKLYQLEKDLRKSIMNDELYVEYQPKVNPKTSKVEGAEALVRWKHPEWGIVSPGEFISLAEENGFILKLGDWVLKEVCELIGSWTRNGINVVPISVNVSPKRLLKADFVEQVKDTILSAGIDPCLIELELTEQTVIKNTETTKNIITELKAFGVKFALDDFGTGYSSLSYLKDMDIDTLKIDKSFIDGITTKKANDAIVKSLIYLTKEVDINIVAEGVETKAQLNFLLQQECQQIQGYIYSRPVSHMKFLSLLKKELIQPLQTTTEPEVVVNRRKFFRINLDWPLSSDMTIIKFKDKDVILGTSKAIIENLSLGGLKYTSNINLPVQKDVIIQFSTMILGHEVKFTGRNIWKAEVDGFFQYGFEFTWNEVDQDKFATILNKIILQLKQGSMLPDSRILITNRMEYFKG